MSGLSTTQTRVFHPMLIQCWPTVCDAGPTLIQRWVNVSDFFDLSDTYYLLMDFHHI